MYYANTRNFTDRKWGTKNPVMLRDPEFGAIRLRAFGNYALRIKDPVKVIREVAGTDGHFTTDDITEQLKNIIVTRFSDAMASSKVAAIDMAAHYDELSKEIQEKIKPEFDEYGLELTKFLIENVSFPPQVEEAIDKRSSMGVIGNLNNYMQFQAANSLETAAKTLVVPPVKGSGLEWDLPWPTRWPGCSVSNSSQHPRPDRQCRRRFPVQFRFTLLSTVSRPDLLLLMLCARWCSRAA